MSLASKLILLSVALLSSVFIALLIRAKRRSLRFLQGPPSPSFFLGYEWEFERVRRVGSIENDWFRQFGSAYRMPGCFGEDILQVADPRALQHICHKSAYRYKKPRDLEHLISKIFGPGVLTVNALSMSRFSFSSLVGDVHQRQRKILNPAFSAAQIKPFAQLFASSVQSLTLKWRAEIEGDTKVIDIYKFLHRMALDSLGETMFEYDFNALGGKKTSELRDIMRDLFSDSNDPTEFVMLRNALYRFVPSSLTNLMALKKTKEDRRFAHWLKASQAVSEDLTRNKTENGGGGEKDKDLLSVLARSMKADDQSKTLFPAEALSQMAYVSSSPKSSRYLTMNYGHRTIIFAGHETTASTMNWVLYELSRNPKTQEQLFREIKDLREQTGNDGAFSAQELESLVYLNAVIKETLRFHPIVPEIIREADEDDVIPLDDPVVDSSGLKPLWGEDADEWKPERFFDKSRPTTLGVFANLMTFSAGVRACIGWRFAVLELQVVIAALVESFVFAPVDGVEIERVRIGVSPPMVKGKWESGPQLPMKVALRQA
ncbi:hypothetical protein V5O48_005082 [Marasmius crinis-equi]|uniref:Cytochrome P450 n=1 Tax=Marasmius crinis-equi TaxID=585013 RepID=A0ABR3FNE5_9AGAR